MGEQRPALVLFLFYVYVSGMRPRSCLSSHSLIKPAFRAILHAGWFIENSVSTLVTASLFLAGNREAELNPTTFSSLLLFRVFLSFLFPTPTAI